MIIRAFKNWCFAVLMFLLLGCSGPRLMMPTPNVYLDAERDVFAKLAKPLKDTEVELLYVTDREPEQDEDGKLRYGTGRSASLALGTTVVHLGVDTGWEELLEASRTQQRLNPINVELHQINELVRTPNLPLPYAEVDGKIFEQPDLVKELDEAAETFRRIMVRALSLTPRKEVFIFVHGYHNTFEDAAFAMAELWHFLGRIGVPVIYSWPAGYPGMFGYTYDRESSEYTIYHLRETLEFISGFPEVEKIHLIAHSRGTDVATAAVRELTIKARAAGIDPKKRYKIHNLVLAAPDLDVEVATQRFTGDKIDLSVNRWTVYTSPSDKAIGIASMLFASPRGRVGTFGINDLDESIRIYMEFSKQKHRAKPSVAFINYPHDSNSQRDQYAHSYFRNAPAVSSDLILMLRDDQEPGSLGRPLEHIELEFWRIPDGYPDKKPHE